MPATIYAVAGGKGGVGKTTTAANLAATLRATGREVLLVDADLAMSNLQGMIGLSHEPTLHDVLAGEAALSEAIVHESEDVLDTEGRLDILPGSAELDAFAAAGPQQLPDVVDSIAPEYDTIILDTASGVSPETAIPLRIADRTIVVTSPERASVLDAKKTVDFVEHVGGRVAGLVISRTCLGLDEAEIVEHVGIDHLATVPDLDVPGVDPLTPYRRLVVRLLLGREIATDPAAVLDIDDGETPRITSTLEPTPEPDPVVDGTLEDEALESDADDTDENGPTEAADGTRDDGDTAPAPDTGTEIEVTADGGASVDDASDAETSADVSGAEEPDDDGSSGRIGRFVDAISRPNGQ